ncbi:hypothetical protein VTJ04DRAFT_6191 [Mycothermus thermophilus]|uniref:uncharacterized protein n=1 Tax=Humicola insolens TaxID=85995 RepID=UPI003742CE8F
MAKSSVLVLEGYFFSPISYSGGRRGAKINGDRVKELYIFLYISGSRLLITLRSILQEHYFSAGCVSRRRRNKALLIQSSPILQHKIGQRRTVFVIDKTPTSISYVFGSGIGQRPTTLRTSPAHTFCLLIRTSLRVPT